MTTSNTQTWNPTRDQILKRSLRLVHAYPASGNPRPEQLLDALHAGNAMLKTWQMDDLLWLRQDATLFLNKGQAVYYLAPTTYTGFSHCATAYVQTTIATAYTAGGLTATLTSGTGITTGEYIGIENDDGIIEWTTVTISGTTATLAVALTSDAAAGNVVYCHTSASQIKRPTKVSDAYRKLYHTTAANGTEAPIDVCSKGDYEAMSSKTSQGSIVMACYDPQLTAGKFFVWPTSDSCKNKLVLSIDRPIDDLLADTETVDAPKEWIEAIEYGIADRIAPEYQLPLQERQLLKAEAQAAYNKILSFNREGSIFFEMG